MSDTTEKVEQSEGTDVPQTPTDDTAACIRANVAAFRSADNASMMGGWTS
ncbi:hypothetical protein [Streptomyces sp. ODS05-4]|nr:hypothetical protein [Streptomyces sp. ODS05-4]